MACSFHTILAIGGSDSSAGAGIQADLKAAMTERVYALTVVTAVTAQATGGVYDIVALDPHMVRAQLEAVCSDCRPDAVKTGLLPSPAVADTIIGFLKKNLPGVPLVVDPVLSSSAGQTFSDSPCGMRDFYVHELLPLATAVTPNIPEAKTLLGATDDLNSIPTDVRPDDQVEIAKLFIEKIGPEAVVVKGGHGQGQQVTDVLARKAKNETAVSEVRSPRLDCHNLHGTGCTFASLLACRLALGEDMKTAFFQASRKMHRIIAGSCNHIFGCHGNGCLDTGHFKHKNKDNYHEHNA